MPDLDLDVCCAYNAHMNKYKRMVVVSFHCDPELKKKLEERAAKLGWRRNFLIRECLRKNLAMMKP